VIATLHCGGQLLLSASKNDVVSFLQQHDIKVLFGVKATYQDLLHPSATNVLSSVNIGTAFSAGAPLPVDVHQKFTQQYRVSIKQDYGSTETGTISLEEHVIESGHVSDSVSTPFCVGFPLDHIQITTVPPNPDSVARRSNNGDELWVRGKAVAIGYLKEGLILPCVDHNGWFHTRDIVQVDQVSKRIFMVDRLRAPLLVNENTTVYPQFIEEKILEGYHAAWREGAPKSGIDLKIVIAVGNQKQSEFKVKLVVVPAEGVHISASSLEDWCKLQFPELLFIMEIVAEERLPRSPAGKLLLKYL